MGRSHRTSARVEAVARTGASQPAIAAVAALVAVLAHLFCRLQAMAGLPLCSGGGASPAGLLCLASGVNAAAVVLVAAVVCANAARTGRPGHAG